MTLLLSLPPLMSVTRHRAPAGRILLKTISFKHDQEEFFQLFSRTTRRTSSSSNTTSSSADKEQIVLIHNLPNGIKHVELNRPDKLNSLNLKMFHAIAQAAQQIRKDPSARAVVLSGKGRAFCTGLDVNSILKPSLEDGILPMEKIRTLLQRPSGYERQEGEGRELDDAEDESSTSTQTSVEDLYEASAFGNLAQDIALLWRNIPIPVIAVLNGMCFGGGLQLALGADMRYATKDCKLSVMEAKWGLIPDMSATITLRELVRIDVAKELTYTGKVVDGTQAEALGLITRTCEDPMEEAMKVAEAIASKSPDSIAAAKILYQKSWFASEKDCLELETDIQKRLLVSWNQMAASAKNFGVHLPYKDRQDFDK